MQSNTPIGDTSNTETYTLYTGQGVQYTPDFSSRDGINEFFINVTRGYFNNHIDALKEIISSTSITDSKSYRAILEGLKQIFSNVGGSSGVEEVLQIKFSEKLDLTQIEIDQLQLLELLLEARLLDNGLMDDKLQEFARTLDIDEIVKQAESIETILTNTADTVHRRYLYDDVFDVLHRTGILDLHPEILEEIVQKTDFSSYGSMRLNASLVSAFANLAADGFEFDSEVLLATLDNLIDKAIDTANDVELGQFLRTAILDGHTNRTQKVFDALIARYETNPEGHKHIPLQIETILSAMESRGVTPPSITPPMAIPQAIR